MVNQSRRHSNHKPRHLTLPELDQSKASVLNTLGSLQSRRSYQHAMDEFIAWYCSEPRLAFNRIVVLRYRMHLESVPLAPATINLRLAAVRRLAYEASDSGLLSPELVAGIRRVKGVKRLGQQVGNLADGRGGSTTGGRYTHRHASRQTRRRNARTFAGLRPSAIRGGQSRNRKDSASRRTLGDCRPGGQGRPRADGAGAALGQECNRQLERRCQHSRRQAVSSHPQEWRVVGSRPDTECRLVRRERLREARWNRKAGPTRSAEELRSLVP